MKSIIIFTAFTLYNVFAFAQTDATIPTSESEIAKKNTLTLGTVYANNASYYGQKSDENTAYVAMAANYRFKSGFYLTGQAYKLLKEQTSTVSASSLGAGVNFKLSERLTADLSYNHSFYPANSTLLQAGNADNVSFSLTHESWLNVSLTGDYAFGKTNDGFATGALSKSINLFSIGKKDIVTINPSADIVAGTQHFYQTYRTEQKIRNTLLGIIPNPLTGGSSQDSISNTVAKTSFNILSYNFKLPLAYNRSHYVVEAAYQLSVLSKKAESGTGKNNSFVTLSFYYQF